MQEVVLSKDERWDEIWSGIKFDQARMKNNDFEYACRVSLPVKKDGNKCLCGDYRPLNMQIRRDSFPMPLIDDVLSQMRSNQWFSALDLQTGFWQIRMSPNEVKKTSVITKFGLYDWIVMPFGLKNATGTFSKTIAEIFKDWTNQFLKVFVDDVNIHNQTWEEHLHIWRLFLHNYRR
jgi:hypothetical protein